MRLRVESSRARRRTSTRLSVVRAIAPALRASAPIAIRPRTALWRRRPTVRRGFLAYAAGVSALGVTPASGLPRPPMVPLASMVPLAVGAALPRGRLQYAATWAAYVWLFKVAWEIPYDKPEKLQRHLHLHYPIRIDAAIGAGVPPGVRLQRALRDRSARG